MRFSSSESTVSVTNSFSRIGHLGKQCCKHLFIYHIRNILVQSLFIKSIESSLKGGLGSELGDPRGRMTSQFSMDRSRKVSSASTTSNVSIQYEARTSLPLRFQTFLVTQVSRSKSKVIRSLYVFNNNRSCF